MNNYYLLSIDLELAKQKGLVENQLLSNKYFELQKKYMNYFLKYIISKLELVKYDNIISNNYLKFGICDIENQDIYQKSSGLNYIYIKNDMHIEKLSFENLQILENGNEEQIKNLIINTYSEIIKSDVINNIKFDRVFDMQLYPNFSSEDTIVSSNALVIVIREGDSKNNLSGESFRINLREKFDFINKLISEMKLDFMGKLDCPINIIHLLR